MQMLVEMECRLTLDKKCYVWYFNNVTCYIKGVVTMAVVTDAVKFDIIQKINAGWTQDAVMQHHGVSRMTIHRLLKKNNITPPKKTITPNDKVNIDIVSQALSEPKIVELTSQLTVANLSESQQDAIENHIGFDKSVLDSLKLIDINLRNGIATNTIPVDMQVDLIAKLAMTLDKLGLINSVSNVGVDDVVVKINLGSKATVEPIKEKSEVENGNNDRTTQNVS